MKYGLNQISLGGIVIIADWCKRAQPTVGGTIPRLGLEYIKRLVEHEPEKSNKQHSTMVFSSVPALVYLSDK